MGELVPQAGLRGKGAKRSFGLVLGASSFRIVDDPGVNGTRTLEILLVPIGIGVLRDFTPEQPIDNAEIEEREHNAEDPPGQADAKGVRTGDRAGYRDALATRTC